MDVQHNHPVKLVAKRRMADIPLLINFIPLMIIYIGVVLYAIQNGQVANGFTYIHNMIKQGVDVESNARVAIQILDEIIQARFVILGFTFLAVLWSILTIAAVQKATSLVIYLGIVIEMILLSALLVLAIFASQSQMYRNTSSMPYLFFPLFIWLGLLKLLALKEVGLPFLTNLLRESCRVITRYWLGFLIMFLIHILALSSLLFGFYVFCQLQSTSLKTIRNEIQTEDGISLEKSNFVMTALPIHVCLFHTINIMSITWLHNTFWYFGYVLLSRSFAVLYQDPEVNCNSINVVLQNFGTIMRYHIGTIIYAASPFAFIIPISVMWKYVFDNTNEYLRQKPFIGSLSWLVTTFHLPETGLIFCSFRRTAYRQSAELFGRIFIHHPIRLLTVYSVLGWLSLFFITLVSIATLTAFHIYTEITTEQPWADTATILILFGAVAMTGTVCQLFRIAVLSIYIFMVQNIQQASIIEDKKPINPAIEKIIVQCHGYI